MTATGAREGVIALKEKYRRAIDALTPLLPAGIRLHILPDVYPVNGQRAAGHRKLLLNRTGNIEDRLHVIDHHADATVDDPGFINGGPMMGGLITSLDNPVTKTTGGLLGPRR
jgi:Na+-translocating ferredoxin:NAD+ oxidoreductase RnfC subunit